MGFRFHKSFKLFGIFKVNLSKSGASLTAGVPGFHVNVNPTTKRVTTTASAPGTGISYRQTRKLW